MIISLSLDEEQQAVLLDQLECCIDELRTEIMDTDRHDYREQLKKRREVVHHILNSIREAQISQPIV
ncbi:MAG: hypothetical protein AB9891_01935 [Anaerolineaceae bacterium]